MKKRKRKVRNLFVKCWKSVVKKPDAERERERVLSEPKAKWKY